MTNVRSITPLPPADFTPEVGNYKTLQPFRYWCQKVLPLVYDDSLSYYELLCKVVDYLNKTMEDVETLHGDVTNLHTAYEELQSYVNNYFSTLDVQEEINNKLDKMVADGTLSSIINSEIFSKLNSQNFWYNKKVVVYGDSLSDHHNNYWNILKTLVNVDITNRAISGTPLIKSNNNNGGVDMAKNATDLNEFDVIVFAYGTNDWQGSYPIHSASEYSVYRAVELIKEYVTQKAPNSTLIFVTPFYSYRPDFVNGEINHLGYTIEDYCNEICQTANSFGCGVIDFYHTSGCTRENYSSKLLNDSDGIYVHETLSFSRVLASIVSNFTLAQGVRHVINSDNMLCGMMFGEYTSGITNTIINNLSTQNKSGVALVCNTSVKSTGITLTIYSEYAICGYTNNPITLSIGDFSINLNKGDFYVTFRVNASSVSSINITSAQLTYICGLQMYNITIGGNYWGSFGFHTPFTYKTGFTNATPNAVPGYVIKDELLCSNGFAVNCTNETQAGTDIVDIKAYFPFPVKILGIANGVPVLLEIYKSTIRTAQSIPINSLLWVPAFTVCPNTTQVLL